MTARDHLQPQQLAMFMTAQELHDMHSIDVQQSPDSRYGGAWKSMDAMWKTKHRENDQGGVDALGKNVAAQGVHRPVELSSGSDVQGEVISDGHHRVQAAFEHNPQSYVPVVHRDLDRHHRGGTDESSPIPGWTDKPRFPSYP